jgi:hypothetical protein
MLYMILESIINNGLENITITKQRVFDCWWPWRTGRIIKHTSIYVIVQWSDKEIWRYDKSHLKFLKRVK